MLRRVLIASAAAAMLLVTFTPDEAYARRGGGMRAGGFHGGGAVAVRGPRGGAVAAQGYRGGTGIGGGAAVAAGVSSVRLRNEKGVVLELRGAKIRVEVSANLALITIQREQTCSACVGSAFLRGGGRRVLTSTLNC